MKSIYINLGEINELQENIMKVMMEWAHTKKTPVPLKSVMNTMEKQGVKRPTIINSIHGLLVKGYIRKAYIVSNKTYFVLLRSV